MILIRWGWGHWNVGLSGVSLCCFSYSSLWALEAGVDLKCATQLPRFSAAINIYFPRLWLFHFDSENTNRNDLTLKWIRIMYVLTQSIFFFFSLLDNTVVVVQDQHFRTSLWPGSKVSACQDQYFIFSDYSEKSSSYVSGFNCKLHLNFSLQRLWISSFKVAV